MTSNHFSAHFERTNARNESSYHTDSKQLGLPERRLEVFFSDLQSIITISVCGIFTGLGIALLCWKCFSHRSHSLAAEASTSSSSYFSFSSSSLRLQSNAKCLPLRIYACGLWIGCGVLIWFIQMQSAEATQWGNFISMGIAGWMDATLLWANFPQLWMIVSVIVLRMLFHIAFGVALLPSVLNNLAEQKWLPSALYTCHLLTSAANVICAACLLLLTTRAKAPPSHQLFFHTKKKKPPSNVGFASQLFLCWMQPIVQKANRQLLSAEDFLELPSRQTTVTTVNLDEFHFSLTHGGATITAADAGISLPQFWLVFLRIITPTLLCAIALDVGAALLEMVLPFLVGLFLTELSHPQMPIWSCFLLALGFFTVEALSCLVHEQSVFMVSTLAVRIQSTLTAALYRQAAMVPAPHHSTGQILNLMSVDVKQVQALPLMLTTLVRTVLKVSLCVLFLCQLFGFTSILPGCFIIVLLCAINAVFGWYTRAQTICQFQWKDQRLKTLHDMLQGMRVLKLHAWEGMFLSTIERLRGHELLALSRALFAWTSASSLCSVAPFFIMLVSLLTFVYTGGERHDSHILTTHRAFVGVKLFNIMRVPITEMTPIVSVGMNCAVSMQRIWLFLNSSNGSSSRRPSRRIVFPHSDNSGAAIRIQGGSFTWSREEAPVCIILKNIHLTIPSGSFIVVLGPCGCGKSSLLSAIVGEMNQLEGCMSVSGSIAYAPQTAWIQHKTIRENILFESELDQEWYDCVLDKCELRTDVERMPLKDATIIGERGVNLSGGQKQRINVARAVYQKADIYLLDDPFSAVDAQVGHSMYRNLLAPGGLLANCTRVLVTHDTNWSESADGVMVMNKDGGISEQGSVKQYHRFPAPSQPSPPSPPPHHHPHPDKKEVEKTIADPVEGIQLEGRNKTTSYLEHVQNGPASLKVFLMYIKARGVWLTAFSFLLGVLISVLHAWTTIWLNKFTNNPIIQNASLFEHIQHPPPPLPSTSSGEEVLSITNYFMTWYGLAALLLFSLSLVNVGGLAYGSIRAARSLHRDMLTCILKAPMSFFHSTPNGQIINRFSRDIDEVDTSLHKFWSSSIRYLCALLAAMLGIVYSIPLLSIFLLPLLAVYAYILMANLPIAMQSRRWTSISKSPLFVHCTETLAGLGVIHAANKTARFVAIHDALIHTNARCLFVKNAALIYLSIRLEILGPAITFLVVLLILLCRNYIPAALGASAVSFSLTTTENLLMFMRKFSHLETDLVAIERIAEYSTLPPEEEEEEEKKEEKEHNSDNDDHLPLHVRTEIPSDWPALGCVQFVGYSARYREDLPLSLRDIHLTLQAGEKVSIVGRTGAGKTSLALSLFRLFPNNQGRIEIDGIDISHVGLAELRTRISIISQDVFLLQGSLRKNVDPLELHSDAELWNVMEWVRLKEWICSLPGGLNYACHDSGENISLGQRQLICLARALLRRSKLLILDEATASVSGDVEHFLVHALLQYFESSTVLLITHKLQTIFQTNRVIVMQNGEIAEVGRPPELMANPTSMLHHMVSEAGL